MIKVHTVIQRIEGNNRRMRDVNGNENVKLPAFSYRHTMAYVYFDSSFSRISNANEERK